MRFKTVDGYIDKPNFKTETAVETVKRLHNGEKPKSYKYGDMQKALGVLGKVNPVKVEDKYSAQATLDTLDNYDPEVGALIYMFGTYPRGSCVSFTQASKDGARWSALTPIFLYAMKEYKNIAYSDWLVSAEEKQALSMFLGVALQPDTLGLLDVMIKGSKVLSYENLEPEQIKQVQLHTCKQFGNYNLNSTPNMLKATSAKEIFGDIDEERAKQIFNFNNLPAAVRAIAIQSNAARGIHRCEGANILSLRNFDEVPTAIEAESVPAYRPAWLNDSPINEDLI